MKKYKVIRTCFGFKGRMWEEGQVVELDDNIIPPTHFVDYYEAEKLEKPQSTKPDPMKPQTIEFGKQIHAKGGFAASVNKEEPKSAVTSGAVMKNDTGKKKSTKE